MTAFLNTRSSNNSKKFSKPTKLILPNPFQSVKHRARLDNDGIATTSKCINNTGARKIQLVISLFDKFFIRTINGAAERLHSSNSFYLAAIGKSSLFFLAFSQSFCCSPRNSSTEISPAQTTSISFQI